MCFLWKYSNWEGDKYISGYLRTVTEILAYPARGFCENCSIFAEPNESELECNMISEVCRWRTDTSLFTEVGKVTFKIIVAFNYCMNHRGDCIYIRQDVVMHVAGWVLRTQRWKAPHKIDCWGMKEIQDPIAASNTICIPWPGLRP